MRIKNITLSGFRGFAQTTFIDLDADAVIVSGANGRGKTSMFDGILWALTGSVDRLHCEAGDIVSRYSPTGEARVELQLCDDESVIKVVRRFDGKPHLSVESLEGIVRDSVAEAALVDLLWPEARAASEPREALSRSLTRAMYLQQDVVREFVEADDEQQRFSVISELVGVGRVTELQRQLESSRTAWSRVTNRLGEEIHPLRMEISQLEERLSRLGEMSATKVEETEFESWARDVQRYTGDDTIASQQMGVSAVELALETMKEKQRLNERMLSSLQRLIGHIVTEVPEVSSMVEIRAGVEASELEVSEISNQLLLAQEALASELRRQTELHDEIESRRALSELALRHLGERCPVCDQAYDKEATRVRLEFEIGEPEVSLVESRSRLWSSDEVATRLEIAQRQLASNLAVLRAAERDEVLRFNWEQTRLSLASDAGLEVSTNLHAEAESSIATLREQSEDLQRLIGMSGELLLRLVGLAEQEKKAEIKAQVLALRKDLGTRENEQDARIATGEMANRLLAGLRSASTRIVTEELDRISPLLQSIYSSVDPHPSFRTVRFLTSISRGHGQVWTSVQDKSADQLVTEPSLVLSSSQLNVLAVCTFLTLNLAIETLPLQVVAMDDPLQSLDTVNLLGLSDLLRRVRVFRQILVSTHDDRLADLMARKLRPVTEKSRTRIIKFEAWTRDGPVVEQYDVPADQTPMKLVRAS